MFYTSLVFHKPVKQVFYFFGTIIVKSFHNENNLTSLSMN